MRFIIVRPEVQAMAENGWRSTAYRVDSHPETLEEERRNILMIWPFLAPVLFAPPPPPPLISTN